MSKITEGLKVIDEGFAGFGFPAEFLAEYDQLECLSSRKGKDTFLVRSRADGSLAVAKCYDKSVFSFAPGAAEPASSEVCKGLPRFIASYESESCVCVLREYIDGTPLSEYVKTEALSRERIREICLRLCDILIYLHGLKPPVIHRDIKPENVIIDASGGVWLIDFDIAREFKPEAESDTFFFGTKGYAPPEQYGFAQTDARADIYSLGVLLRFLLTGSVRANANVRVYRPLQKVIDKCTAFAPEKRYADVRAVKKALKAAGPQARVRRTVCLIAACAAGVALLAAGSIAAYKALTYTPFTEGYVPAYVSDEKKVAEGVKYMRDNYDTDMFDASDDIADIGLLRRALIELYGLDRDYVYGVNTDMPQESDDFFLPWGWDDGQTIDRDIAVYAAVKVHDPGIVADWSSLKDDNGYYPGVRLAVAFSDARGLTDGVNKPGDLSIGELALILANADRFFYGLSR